MLKPVYVKSSELVRMVKRLYAQLFLAPLLALLALFLPLVLLVPLLVFWLAWVLYGVRKTLSVVYVFEDDIQHDS